MLSGMFQWAVRESAELETLMTSVERMLEFVHLPPEAPLQSDPGAGTDLEAFSDRKFWIFFNGQLVCVVYFFLLCEHRSRRYTEIDLVFKKKL